MSKENFLSQKIWVVVGDVLNKQKYAHRIWKRLQETGYDVYAVHPSGGEGVSTTLNELKIKPDVLCLVINPKDAHAYLKQSKEIGISRIWIQPGADTPEILELCRQLSLDYLQACVLVALAEKNEES